jgi:tryptophan synthase beta chain
MSKDTYYLIGTAAGPHPYPEMVRDFQAVIGRETREQILEREGRLPDARHRRRRRGIECDRHLPPVPRRRGRQDRRRRSGRQGARRRRALRFDHRRLARRATRQPHLPASGWRRADQGRPFDLGGPRLSRHRPGAFLAERHRPREYVPIMDHEALEAFQLLTRIEGIIPAWSPATRWPKSSSARRTMGKDEIILMNLSGRGDKDIFTVGKILGMEL